MRAELKVHQERGLARAVGGLRRDRLQRSQRRDADDVALAAFQEVFGGGVDRRDRTGDIGLDQVDLLFQFATADVRDVIDAGIDDDRVDAAQAGDELMQRRPDAGGLADIDRRQFDAQGFAASGVDFIAKLLEQRQAAGCQAEREAATGHFQRQCATDSGRGAGNDYGKWGCHGLLSVSGNQATRAAARPTRTTRGRSSVNKASPPTCRNHARTFCRSGSLIAARASMTRCAIHTG